MKVYYSETSEQHTQDSFIVHYRKVVPILEVEYSWPHLNQTHSEWANIHETKESFGLLVTSVNSGTACEGEPTTVDGRFT